MANDDVLAAVPVDQVAAWYERLARGQMRAAPELQPALAGLFLLKWLENRSPATKLQFSAPDHLKKASAVLEVLRYHRAVFLTEKKARVKGGEKWGGLLPRIQGLTGYAKWDMHGMVTLPYQSLCDFAPWPWDIARIQQYGSSSDRDLLGSLRGFQLKSNATFTGKLQGGKASIRCFNWDCWAIDRYDWNYSEHLTMPNPDYKSAVKGAIAPEQQLLKVYHKNAKRLEDAKLAAPYDLEVGPWTVTQAEIIQDASIDTTRRL
jgi:hypothetical protein